MGVILQLIAQTITQMSLLPRYGGYSWTLSKALNTYLLLPRYGGYSMTMVPPSKGYTVASPLWGLFYIYQRIFGGGIWLLPRYGGYSHVDEDNKGPHLVASPLWGLFLVKVL